MPNNSDTAKFENEQFLDWLSTLTTATMSAKLWGEEAVRLSDIVNGAVEAGYGNRGWIAFRLDTGASNDHVYEDRDDAIEDAQRDLSLVGSRCGFVKVPLDGMSPKAAQSYIRFCRRLDAGGFRLQDPQGKGGRPMLSRYGRF